MCIRDSPVEALSLALTERTMRARSEVYKVPLNAQAARDARDALAKEIYVRAFDWIVKRINASTSSSGETSTSGGDLASLANGVDKVKVVGLLDIFGFESFAVNRFEQLSGQDKRAKFQTSKPHISAVFHSFWLIFGRAIISRNGLEAWMFFFPERARAEHSR